MIVCLRAQAVNVCLIYDDSNRFLFLKHARAETRSVKMNINPSPAPSGDSGLCTRGGGGGTCKKNDWGRKSCSNADSKYRMWPSASKEHIFLRLRSTDNVRGMLQPLWLMKKKHIWVFSVFFFFTAFRRNAPNIEDALSQIQGSSYTQQSSFLSSSTNINR